MKIEDYSLPDGAMINPEITYPSKFGYVYVEVDPKVINQNIERLNNFTNQFILVSKDQEPDPDHAVYKRPSRISPLAEDRRYLGRHAVMEMMHRATLREDPELHLINGTHRHIQIGGQPRAKSLGGRDPGILEPIWLDAEGNPTLTWEDTLTMTPRTWAEPIPVDEILGESPADLIAHGVAKIVKDAVDDYLHKPVSSKESYT